MKRHVETFNKFNKLNEQVDIKSMPPVPVLWIQSLKGEIQWMTVSKSDILDQFDRGAAYVMEDGQCDKITVVDISGGLSGREQCDIFAGGNRPSNTPELDLYIEGAKVIKTMDASDFEFSSDEDNDEDDDYPYYGERENDASDEIID